MLTQPGLRLPPRQVQTGTLYGLARHNVYRQPTIAHTSDTILRPLLRNIPFTESNIRLAQAWAAVSGGEVTMLTVNPSIPSGQTQIGTVPSWIKSTLEVHLRRRYHLSYNQTNLRLRQF